MKKLVYEAIVSDGHGPMDIIEFFEKSFSSGYIVKPGKRIQVYVDDLEDCKKSDSNSKKVDYLRGLFNTKRKSLEDHAKQMDEKQEWMYGCKQTVSYTMNNLSFKPEHENCFEGKSFKISMSNEPFKED